jgi:hypothetical protein
MKSKNVKSITIQENMFSKHIDVYFDITPTLHKKIKKNAEIIGISQEELIVAALEAIAQGRYNPCQEPDSSK